MTNQLPILASVLREHKSTLFSRWKAEVGKLDGAIDLDPASLRDHIPQFIDEMIRAIAGRQEQVVGEPGGGSPHEHGMQRLAAGFKIKEVVTEYNILRDAVHEVAEDAGMQFSASESRKINHIIDDAIALAVDTYANEQALELQRRRDEHFAFIAHDVRTPLNAISLTASLLAEDLPPDSGESAEMLRLLVRNVQRIEELIGRVMQEERDPDCSEGLRLIRRNFDLWPLVHHLCLDMRTVTAASQIKVTNIVPRDLMINADANLLSRAFQNLVSNAVRFAPGGEITVGATGSDAGVECWVQDTGMGIAADRMEKLFDKSETDPDPTLAGSGLGLAICKQIVEAHGGTISVESVVGEGAVFRFTIPSAP
ncbi:MAG TPA: sensor histidine kinase [Chthoniobacterales bacterium]|jgi:signal transduction histidine kinase